MLNLFKGQQGAGAGSAYVAFAFATSGLLTFVFHGYAGRSLGEARYGDFAVLWTVVFLVAQVLWIGVSQTLGRYVAEREVRGEDPRPVISSVKMFQARLLAAFLIISLLTSPLLASVVFEGDWTLTVAYVAAVAALAPEYFRRGTFGGSRQFARLGALHVVESSSRLLIAAILLFVGAGMVGPAAAMVFAPIVAVLAVRPVSAMASGKAGAPFSALGALRFAGPVLACVAFAQALMNGGPLIVRLFGGTSDQIALLASALILARTPQYVLSPVVSSLLPHASRALATEGAAGFDRFVLRAVSAVAAVGIAMVTGTWLLGEWAVGLVYGEAFEADRGLLATLAALAAFYLLSETLNQALFALGRGRLAALGWFMGLPVSILCLAVLNVGVVERVAYSLSLGVFTAAVAQTVLYLVVRRRPVPATSRSPSAP
jgi:O-antigen/teichoic acid export membrane protein